MSYWRFFIMNLQSHWYERMNALMAPPCHVMSWVYCPIPHDPTRRTVCVPASAGLGKASCTSISTPLMLWPGQWTDGCSRSTRNGVNFWHVVEDMWRSGVKKYGFSFQIWLDMWFRIWFHMILVGKAMIHQWILTVFSEEPMLGMGLSTLNLWGVFVACW